MKKLLLFIAIFFTFSSEAQVKYPALTASGYEQLKEMVSAILKACPPPKCLVVFPGRSNVLLSAYMEAKKLGHQISLPVSGIRSVDGNITLPKERFTREVLEVFLKPELPQIEKMVVVDYVNHGGSITNASMWIQDYAREVHHPVSVEVLTYGKAIHPQFLIKLEKQSIPVNHLPFSAPAGSPSQLASASLLEDFAPYDQWDPVTTKDKPVIKRTVRRYYPYIDNGKKEFSQYASYDDLVEWFKKDEFVPPSGPSGNCLGNMLGGMFN